MAKIALVTGAANRIGAAIIKALHHKQYQVIIHYKNSKSQAFKLKDQLNNKRTNSASCAYADLTQITDIKTLAKSITKLDLLVNNASVFYAKSIANSTLKDWNNLINNNVRAGFFLSQVLIPRLKKTSGNIINIIDIYAYRPLKNYPIYNISKAALAMMTKTLARELAPDIRVNGIAPGAILPPTNQQLDLQIVKKIPLKKMGSPNDIAQAVLFLANSTYISGQIINIDGGRTINQ